MGASHPRHKMWEHYENTMLKVTARNTTAYQYMSYSSSPDTDGQ